MRRLTMLAIVLLSVSLCLRGQAAEPTPVPVTLPGPDGITLRATLVLPTGPQTAAAVVALHGCGGPWPLRDLDWARRLTGEGHAVLLPDSFGSRGAGSQCKLRDRERVAVASGLRRLDAIAAARWLVAQPGVPAGGVVLMGWSDGGSTTVLTANEAPDLPAGLFRRFIAFYPGCRLATQDATYRPASKMLILMGADDDWTPAAPCHTLAERFPELISMTAYPDTYHDFDVPNRPIRVVTGLPTKSGIAHAGENPAARADALRQVDAFLAATGG